MTRFDPARDGALRHAKRQQAAGKSGGLYNALAHPMISVACGVRHGRYVGVRHGRHVCHV